MRHDELHDAKLHDLAKRLGAGAAERLDVERTAQTVLARLRAEPRMSVVARLWMQPAWLKIAALLVLLLGSGVVARRPWRAGAPGTATVIPVGALDPRDRFDVADASALPWPDGSVDLIVTSPPYALELPYIGGDVPDYPTWLHALES